MMVDVMTYVAELHNMLNDEKNKLPWYNIKHRWVMKGAVAALRTLYELLQMHGIRPEGARFNGEDYEAPPTSGGIGLN